MKRDYRLGDDIINLKGSVLVRDVTGRLKDFSCSDCNFTYNISILFLTPKEFFLLQGSLSFTRPLNLNNFPYKDNNVISQLSDLKIYRLG